MAKALAMAHPPAKLGETERKDAWWVEPLLTAIVFGAFIIYSTVRAMMAINGEAAALYEPGELLSPFFSPNLAHTVSLPAWISPAFLILWAPGGFRVTCYYYRKAYYRSLFMDPPGCAVGEPRDAYKGETRLLLFQNLHRYFLYVALVFIVLLWHDAWKACWPAAAGSAPGTLGSGFGITVGTLVLTMNATLLSLYTFSCHSLRHLIGGKLDCFSCSAANQTRHGAWKIVTKLNEMHMFWAWTSLFGVALTDLYVWMVAAKHITNIRIV
jgi:hypothetical protein